jgi:hypothetical protein
MPKMLTGIAATAVLLLALPALAVPPPNTALTHGYDDENTTLVFGVSDYDDENPADGCAGVEGEYDYELGEDGEITSYESTDEGDDTTDTTVGSEESAEGGDAEEGIECTLNPVDVTGPNGQVNHGTVVSSFVHAIKELDIQGRGCLVRVIAQSGYGKGDQQIKVSDVEAPDSGEGDGEAVTSGTVVLETALTTCAEKGHKADKSGQDDDSKGKPERVGKSDDKGKPEGVGKPDHAGKSDEDSPSKGKPENPGNGNGKNNK